MTVRTIHDIIIDLIESESSVLDLGCGDGALLKRLIDEKAVRGRGLDRWEDRIAICIGRGLSVLQGNLDDGLEDYLSSVYDYVILNRTMQEVRRPDQLLSEMVQFGRRVIVSFPNFGYFLNRLQLLRGCMPVNRHIPYQWYDTPNIHFCTRRDFVRLCRQLRIPILREMAFHRGHRLPPVGRNLTATESLFVLQGRK